MTKAALTLPINPLPALRPKAQLELLVLAMISAQGDPWAAMVAQATVPALRAGILTGKLDVK